MNGKIKIPSRWARFVWRLRKWWNARKAEPMMPETVADLMPIAPRSLFNVDLQDLSFNDARHALKSYFDRLYDLQPKIQSAGDVAMDDTGNGTPNMAFKGGFYAPNLPNGLVEFFLRNSFIGYQMAGMLAQHWLIAKACWMPARDGVRNGYQICTLNGAELDNAKALDLFKLYDKRMKLKRNLVEFIGKGRVFGVRIAFFKVISEDKEYYEKPFNIDGVKPDSYRGIVQVDPYWCAPELDGDAAAKPDSMHFYEPTYWIINGKKYHRSHLIIFRNSDLVDILKPAYIYGGIPMPQQIVERVYAAERTANEAPELSMTKRTSVMKADVEKALAKGPAFIKAMEFFTEMRNNYGVKIIGLEDEMQQFDTSLADFDDLIMTQYQLVSAASGVPSTRLMGTQPKGFNSTGDYEEADYHETLESIVENEPTELVERHHQLVMRSYIAPALGLEKPIDTLIIWNPLDVPTANELADRNLKKAQTNQINVDIGAIDNYDVRETLIEDKDSGYAGLERVERPNGRPNLEAAQQESTEGQGENDQSGGDDRGNLRGDVGWSGERSRNSDDQRNNGGTQEE